MGSTLDVVGPNFCRWQAFGAQGSVGGGQALWKIFVCLLRLEPPEPDGAYPLEAALGGSCLKSSLQRPAEWGPGLEAEEGADPSWARAPAAMAASRSWRTGRCVWQGQLVGLSVWEGSPLLYDVKGRSGFQWFFFFFYLTLQKCTVLYVFSHFVGDYDGW